MGRKYQAGTEIKGRDTDSYYYPVSPLTIFQGTRGPFRVYLKTDEGKHVLYTKEMEYISEEHKKRLSGSGVDEVFILSSQIRDYEHYVEEHIGLILESEDIPIDERAAIFHEYSTQAVRELLEERLPSVKKLKRTHLQRINKLVTQSIDFFSSDEALKKISALLSHGTQMYAHAINVFVFTVCLLNTYELGEQEMVDAGVGAMLHDIGKTMLPAEIMEADSRGLTGEQLKRYQSHPVRGIALCAMTPVAHTTINSILLHHERMDGKGFPAGLYGDELPLAAKALALTNAYDNLTKDRPFRKGLSAYNALKHIQEDMKGQFDKDIFKRFLGVLSGAELI